MVGSKNGLKRLVDAGYQPDQSFEILINNMSDGVILIDHRGIVTMYNASTLQLLDTNQTLTGKLLSQVIEVVDENDETIDLLKKVLKTDRATVWDTYSLPYDKADKIRLEINVAPIKDSQTAEATIKTLGYIIMLRDVTRLKNLEEERDEFISVVSHELRTPITVAEGTLSNLDVLIEREADVTAIKQFADMAHEQVLILANMVNDLSSLARAERQSASNLEPVEIEPMINSIYQKYSRIAEDHKLKFDLDIRITDKIITTNRLYLEEILQNLISNAIKYTKEGSVTLHVEQTGKQIEFAVTDTGIGIPKADRVNIFKKFFRVEDYRTRETSGTGLGLYVCQKLAGKLGTKIELISRLNFGSTFSFTLKID